MKEKNKLLIVELELKRIIREQGLNKEESFAKALEAKVRKELEEIIMRAKLNGRKTVMVRDL